jgi:hypothetical protein
MLVEIAASRCPPASGASLAAGFASTTTTPGLVRLARPGPSVGYLLLLYPAPGLPNFATLPRGRRTAGSAGRQARAGLVEQIVGPSGICQSEPTPSGAYVRYDRKHSDPRRTATGCARHCTSESGASSPPHAGGHGSDPHGWFSGPRSPRVHASGVARLSFASRPRQVGRLKTVARRAEPDRLGAVLALVAGHLARTWTKQQRKQGPTLTAPLTHSGFQPTSERSTWKPWVRCRRQAPLVHEPTCQIIRIQHNGRLTAAPIAGRRP